MADLPRARDLGIPFSGVRRWGAAGLARAVLNALVAARTMTGRDGHRSPGFPVDRLPGLLGR